MIALAAAVIDQRTDIGRQSGFGPTLPAFDAPVTGGGGRASKYCRDVWYEKTRMVWLPDGGNILKI